VDARFWQRAGRRAAIASRPNSPGGLRFPREARIVRRGDFDAVYRAGKRRTSAHFTVFSRANSLPHSRFGFSIKKALGGAVVRNRIRRRLREIVRRHREGIPAGWDIVVHPKGAVAHANFAALSADLVRLLGSAA
jgi:ribonuclease P protein component